jgi:hypothetical protein
VGGGQPLYDESSSKENFIQIKGGLFGKPVKGVHLQFSTFIFSRALSRLTFTGLFHRVAEEVLLAIYAVPISNRRTVSLPFAFLLLVLPHLLFFLSSYSQPFFLIPSLT